MTIDSELRTCHINNRRYLGNKYKLLDFIKKSVTKYCPDVESVADIFAGTGAVSSAFVDKVVFTNDILYSNYICNYAFFSSELFDENKIRFLLRFYNNASEIGDNYMSNNFADTYFSKNDCRKIGYIREDIENRFKAGEINERERAILICSLLYAMDRIANTCGHYDAYIQGVKLKDTLELFYPDVYVNNNSQNRCFNCDSNELVKTIYADLIYIDPPYNSRQYCDAYHLLENVARWGKPEVVGVAKKMDRKNLKSKYCSKTAAESFEDLISNIHAKYIVLSYNNMAKKGNDRSNARISDKDILRILNKKGTVRKLSIDYRAFTTGKSDIEENKERLFICVVGGGSK